MSSPAPAKTPVGAGPNAASRGFTLLELTVIGAVLVTLLAIALPGYRSHVQRSRLGEGVAALADARAAMEQHFLNQRSYVSGPCATSRTVGAFTIVCPNAPTASAYTIRATGSGSAAGAVYTLDHHGDARTTGLPTGWGTPPTGGYPCWITQKGSTC